MNQHIRTHLLAAALLAGFGSTVYAQAPAAPANPTAQGASPRGHHGMDPAKKHERMAQRMADLKQKLQISSAQEPAWNSFTTAMRPPADARRIDRDAMARLNTPDRIDQMRALRQQRMAEMDRRGEATKAFYATLTADQKKVFDAETARLGQRGKRHGHMHG